MFSRLICHTVAHFTGSIDVALRSSVPVGVVLSRTVPNPLMGTQHFLNTNLSSSDKKSAISAGNASLLLINDVPLVGFMYLVFTRIPGESYRRRVGSLFLYLLRISSAN